MSTTEYVLDTDILQEVCGNTDPAKSWWLEHERDPVRIRRVVPECETVWVGEARELARLFAESQAHIERLREELASH